LRWWGPPLPQRRGAAAPIGAAAVLVCQRKRVRFHRKSVILLGTNPPIWRRLLVPADVTLARLHDVLQAAMGWEDGHMHEFCVGRRRIGRPDAEDLLMGMPSVENERTVRLSGILGRVGAKAIYTYDFGDTWEHGVILEKRLPSDPNTTYPVCTDGQLACPPEDCGGIPGFYDLVEAISDPNHKRHEEMRDWIGDDFDPQAFSSDKVNRLLTRMRRHRKASRS
jgi:pRiA4b ORF-3-like protein